MLRILKKIKTTLVFLMWILYFCVFFENWGCILVSTGEKWLCRHAGAGSKSRKKWLRTFKCQFLFLQTCCLVAHSVNSLIRLRHEVGRVHLATDPLVIGCI